MILKITNKKQKWIKINDFNTLNEYVISSGFIKDLLSLKHIKHIIESEILPQNSITKTNLIQNIKGILSGKNNNGCIWRESYWFNRGYSQKESIKKVRKIQRNNAKKFDEKLKEQGYSKDDIHKIRSNNIKKFYEDKDITYKRKKSPRCIEFWLERYNYNEAKEECRKFNDNSSLDYYINKFGEIEGTKKYKENCRKCSLPGEKNPMFGKPSPQGSGNGWSGWYNNHFFRSLLELSYLHYLVNSNIAFVSAENKEFCIGYMDYKNTKRNYYPDFYLLGSKTIIEVKPKNLLNTINNKAKFDEAKKKHRNKFKIVTENDIKKLSNKEIRKLYIDGKIKFINRYDKIYKRKYLNESS